MAEIREYIYSLLVISLACSAVNILTPDNSSVSKYINLLLGLIVTAVLLYPLQSVLNVLPELCNREYLITSAYTDTADRVYADRIISVTCDNVEKEVSDMLEKRFSSKPSDVEVICNSEDISNVIIEKITVKYPHVNRLMIYDVKKYVEETLKSECEVISGD